ncbi:MAG: penicillin-binding protein 2 [Candidatus Aminicenantes bacterium]|nr:penicillin-binding protein 2 [Candidatus Aminicenantes bacterium]
MTKPYQKKIQRRTILLSVFFFLWLGGLTFRLIQMQIIQRTDAQKKILAQNQTIIDIRPNRGTIYGRKGNILARSIPRKSVFYHPFENDSVSQQINKISRLKNIIDLSDKDIQIIKKRIQKNDNFIWIMRKIEDGPAEKVKELDIAGVHMQEEKKRFYPQGKLAAHLLGRVSRDDAGQTGIELYFQSILAGEAGKQINFFDAKRRKYRFEIIKEPVDGHDIILTIDETIQFIAEKELSNAMKERHAEWGTVIISQPQTGDILAMANYPTFDPNFNSPDFDMTDRINSIHYIYDPGSTFKIVTASAAIEFHAVGQNDTFDCSAGSIKIAGKNFKDHSHYDILTFPEVIIHSSNVGTIQVGQFIGEKHLYDMIKKFRFGQRTGIDLPMEEPGLLWPTDRWSKRSLASLSIGYEISVTPIQMLMALNTIANHGMYIPPKVVKKIMISSNKRPAAKKKPIRVISEQTASDIEAILQDVVRFGTGKTARIKGYTITGKTGTAQKRDPVTKRYMSTAHIASFVGYVSSIRPLFSIIVVIDDPKGQYYGSQVAAPVFRAITSKILRYYGIPREIQPEKQLIVAQHSQGAAK